MPSDLRGATEHGRRDLQLSCVTVLSPHSQEQTACSGPGFVSHRAGAITSVAALH